MRRVLHLVRKELLELRQDPRLFGIVIMAPIIQLTVLGYAATTDVKDVPLVVVDADRSVDSRRLISRFEASQNFELVGLLSSTDGIDRWLDSGEAWMALSIPAGYGERVRDHRPVVLQVVADGTDANSTNVALGYARALVAGYAQELAPPGTPPPPVSVEIRVWFNPVLESRTS
ncbi:MAG: ABC transporter permease [Vicinamibacterales bacterium]